MDDIRRAIGLMDGDAIRASVRYLSCDPLPCRRADVVLPGHRLSTLDETDAWLEARLRALGLDVERQSARVQCFGCDPSKPVHHWYAPPPPDAPWFDACNLVAEVRGREAPQETIVLVAHKDSQSWIECPGAYDNAVGTASLLEMARVLAGLGTRRTVRFLFCNEEHTPWTSALAAAAWHERGDRLIAVVNVDSLGGKSDEAVAAGRWTNATLYTVEEGRRLAELMSVVNRRYGLGLDQCVVRREFANDDDGSFVKSGYGCAVANCGSFPYGDAQYHLPGDTAARVDIPNVLAAARMTLAAILHVDRDAW